MTLNLYSLYYLVPRQTVSSRARLVLLSFHSILGKFFVGASRVEVILSIMAEVALHIPPLTNVQFLACVLSSPVYLVNVRLIVYYACFYYIERYGIFFPFAIFSF